MAKIKSVCLWAAVVTAILILCGLVLNLVARNELRSGLAQIPGARIDVGKVSLSLLRGNLEFRDVEINLPDSVLTIADIKGKIESVKLERFNWLGLMRGEARARRLLVRGPEAQVVLTGVAPKEKDSTDNSFLNKIALSEFSVDKGSIGLSSRSDSRKAGAKEIAFSVRDIGIQFPEGQVSYNDSSYLVVLDSLDCIDAKGLMRIQIRHLATSDAGAIKAQGIHAYNCVPREQLAEKMGKVAAMWFDAKLDSLYISPLNIPRAVMGQNVDIDSVSVAGKEVVLFQDDRYLPAVPYTTLQESLNALEMPFRIRTVSAQVPSFTFIWNTTHVNRGAYPMNNIRIAINSISNHRNNNMRLSLKTGRTAGSRADFSLNIRNDRQETTSGTIQVYDMDISKLDDFMRPLFGATLDADIHHIGCTFKGDKHQMTSDFCMLYDNLKVKVWNDATAPYQLVAKNSGMVNFLANLVLPKSNPLQAGKDPKTVEVVFDRDPMPPYASYILQNLTQGMLYTLLPGGGHVRKTKK